MWGSIASSPLRLTTAVVSCIFQRSRVFRMTHVTAGTSVLLRCWYAFFLSIVQYCSYVSGSGDNCHLQRQVCAVARQWPDQGNGRLNHRLCVAGLRMLYKVNSNSKHCQYCDRAAQLVDGQYLLLLLYQLIYTSLKFVCLIHINSYKSFFLPAELGSWVEWRLPYVVSDFGTFNGFKGTVNRWLLPWACFNPGA